MVDTLICSNITILPFTGCVRPSHLLMGVTYTGFDLTGNDWLYSDSTADVWPQQAQLTLPVLLFRHFGVSLRVTFTPVCYVYGLKLLD